MELVARHAIGFAAVGDAIETVLKPLVAMTPQQLRAQRREKFLAMGNRGL